MGGGGGSFAIKLCIPIQNYWHRMTMYSGREEPYPLPISTYPIVNFQFGYFSLPTLNVLISGFQYVHFSLLNLAFLLCNIMDTKFEFLSTRNLISYSLFSLHITVYLG